MGYNETSKAYCVWDQSIEESHDVTFNEESRDVTFNEESRDVTFNEESRDVTFNEESRDVTFNEESRDVTFNEESLNIATPTFLLQILLRLFYPLMFSHTSLSHQFWILS